MKTKVLTIYRQLWYRGHGSDESRLLVTEALDPNHAGQMCCLGFDALNCGLSPEEIAEREMPKAIEQVTLLKHPDYFQTRASQPVAYTTWMNGIATINDAEIGDANGTRTEETREQDIRRLFIKHLGYEDVVFSDEDPPADLVQALQDAARIRL
jgi:hypothetical protein